MCLAIKPAAQVRGGVVVFAIPEQSPMQIEIRHYVRDGSVIRAIEPKRVHAVEDGNADECGIEPHH
jgi:hypothetical protein